MKLPKQPLKLYECQKLEYVLQKTYQIYLRELTSFCQKRNMRLKRHCKENTSVNFVNIEQDSDKQY